jgi:hypothetical protein
MSSPVSGNHRAHRDPGHLLRRRWAVSTKQLLSAGSSHNDEAGAPCRVHAMTPAIRPRRRWCGSLKRDPPPDVGAAHDGVPIGQRRASHPPRITGRRRLRAGRQDSAAAIASPGSSAPHGAQPDLSDRCPPLLAMVVSGIASGLGIPVWARIVGCGKLTFLLVGRSGLRGDSLKFSLCGLLRLRLGVLDPRLRLEVIPGAPRPAAVVERPHIPAPRNANVHGRDRSPWSIRYHRDPAPRRASAVGSRCRP